MNADAAEEIAMPVGSIDEYLAGVADDKRAALARLREQIRAAAPDATEAISYGMPAFRLEGRYLLGFGVTKTQCSFYVGRAPLVAHAAELAGRRLWKGTINFPADEPLPADLVERIVRLRVAERRSGVEG